MKILSGVCACSYSSSSSRQCFLLLFVLIWVITEKYLRMQS